MPHPFPPFPLHLLTLRAKLSHLLPSPPTCSVSILCPITFLTSYCLSVPILPLILLPLPHLPLCLSLSFFHLSVSLPPSVPVAPLLPVLPGCDPSPIVSLNPFYPSVFVGPRPSSLELLFPNPRHRSLSGKARRSLEVVFGGLENPRKSPGCQHRGSGLQWREASRYRGAAAAGTARATLRGRL